jgi:flagellar basal-body rod protein FlgF
MQSSLYVALSSQIAVQKRLETIASNVANMNTVGYRADGVSFEAEIARAGDGSVAFVSPGQSYVARAAGPLNRTGNPLDVAVQGDGWLGMMTPNGPAYTRDGRMQITATGGLQTLNGYPVLDAGGAPILIDPNAGAPTIAADGMITQNGHQVGAIGLFSIDPTAKLTRTDNSGVVPSTAAAPILDFTQNGIVQGSVEGSNVNPILEMTKLISVSRAFDDISTEMSQTESSMQDAIKTLGSSS